MEEINQNRCPDCGNTASLHTLSSNESYIAERKFVKVQIERENRKMNESLTLMAMY